VSHWDNLWDASFSSPSGSVELNIPGLSNDSCLVVISGQNKIPLIKTIYISEINNEYINLKSALVDDSDANNNGVVDYGETFYLTATVSNLGQSDATELFGRISTTSDWVTVIKDTAIIGTLPAKSEITVSERFMLAVDDLISDRGFITLDLMLKDNKTEKHYKLDIQLHAPQLKIANCIIDDTQTGNGDYVADPGETVKLLISVSNSGSSSTSGLLRVTDSPPGITISQPTVSTGNLQPGATNSIPVTITISPLLLKGTSFDISIMLDCNPYVDNETFSIPVGRIRESFEYNTFTMFPWINSATSPWTIISGQSFEGQFSARSAVISNNSESVLKIYVNTPYKDTVKFMYKVSSETNYDYLAFRLNNVQVMKVSGEVGWSEKKAELREGFNLLEWIYKKDESVSVGMDCALIDLITFPAAGFNKIDLKTGKIVTPQPNKDYAQETITAQVINFGTDTIKTFNLAYTVNNGIPVSQVFSKKIAPADTGVVAFSAQANLIGDGTYLIKVYGFNNNDGYLKNDTASLTIINTAIIPVENPDNNVRIMPNPFDSSFRIMLNSPDNENLIITIFDPSGKALLNKNLSVMPGDNILTITPDNLDTGLYILHIKGKSIYKVARIIKK